jgi:hypothetical protein
MSVDQANADSRGGDMPTGKAVLNGEGFEDQLKPDSSGDASPVDEVNLPDHVRVLNEAELVEQQKRLKREGDRSLIVDGAWRSVPLAEFRTAFPGCIRVVNRRFKYTIMNFETNDQALAALKVLQEEGFMDRKPDVGLQSDRWEYKDLDTRKFDITRLQVLGLNGKVPTSKLKESFPTASNVIYHNGLSKTGLAIVTFGNEETATEAFFASGKLQIKDKEVSVVYCQYRPNQGYRDRRVGRYQNRNIPRRGNYSGYQGHDSTSSNGSPRGMQSERLGRGVGDNLLQSQTGITNAMGTITEELRLMREEFAQLRGSIANLSTAISAVASALLRVQQENNVLQNGG